LSTIETPEENDKVQKMIRDIYTDCRKVSDELVQCIKWRIEASEKRNATSTS